MATNSEINIDPNVLNERATTYSSLTDINGLDVFTDSFQKKVTQNKKNTMQPYKTVEGEIFIKSMDTHSDIYEQVKSNMFVSSEMKVLENTSKASSSGFEFAIPIIGIVFIIVIIIMIRYVEKRRKRWKKHDVNAYAYE